jgi:N-acetylglutamate synthase-like GNAT family acetyltransferase
MKNYEIIYNNYLISTDKSKLDINVIHSYLSKESYWAQGRSIEKVRTSIDTCLCFGLYHKDKQVGFARVLTDKMSIGYIADVFVLQEFRGRGMSKLLMKTILEHPELQDFKRWFLLTKDAHGLYKQFGFDAPKEPDRYMEMTKEQKNV